MKQRERERDRKIERGEERETERDRERERYAVANCVFTVGTAFNNHMCTHGHKCMYGCNWPMFDTLMPTITGVATKLFLDQHLRA